MFCFWGVGREMRGPETRFFPHFVYGFIRPPAYIHISRAMRVWDQPAQQDQRGGPVPGGEKEGGKKKGG